MEFRADEDLRARKEKPLPEMFLSKSTAGGGFEVVFGLREVIVPS